MVGNFCHCDMSAGLKMIEVLCLPYRAGFVVGSSFISLGLAMGLGCLATDDITLICSDEKVFSGTDIISSMK
ncbi:hypothetical protein Ddye_004873 [Dipteronia dyeriana]|uniref:Uncharacterized protein n=1 Tax=Dipteronia dyeriana TaxID=168575 RepID=A0AAD9XFG2_9ROSI|nr:hypothetical protein Ddye_004873 [Dipteronia dyeriana]